MPYYKSISPHKIDERYLHFQALRAMRSRSVYRVFYSGKRKKSLDEILGSRPARAKFLDDALRCTRRPVHSANDLLNRAMAEMVFGYGAEKVALKAGLSSKALYRSFSFDEKRRLKVDTVDRVLRTFCLRLAVVPLTQQEQLWN